MERRCFVLIVLCSFGLSSVNSQEVCDEVDCSQVKCLQRYDPFQCPPDSKYSAKGALCGCCPACVYYKKYGEVCLGESGENSGVDLAQYFTPKGTFPMPSAPVIYSQKCAPGLKCENAKCEYPTGSPPSDCTNNKWENALWKPQCDTDGTYAPVQCKANGLLPRCFCYSKEGTRTFGWDLSDNRDKMGCLCSRLVLELKKTTSPLYSDLVFHCSENGNFEPLQCNNGLCACVNVTTGQPLTAFVHESLWKNLPCYTKKLGGQFVRSCDSQSIAARNIKKELSQHGSRASLKVPPCDPDGSYAAKQCDSSSSCFCRTRNNVNIGSYFVVDKTDLEKSMNCYCARDKVIFNEKNVPFPFDCEQNGNYKAQLTSDTGASPCDLDSDGFFTNSCDMK